MFRIDLVGDTLDEEEFLLKRMGANIIRGAVALIAAIFGVFGWIWGLVFLCTDGVFYHWVDTVFGVALLVISAFTWLAMFTLGGHDSSHGTGL